MGVVAVLCALLVCCYLFGVMFVLWDVACVCGDVVLC